ncbi:glutamyl-tRNA reductase [Cellulomonas flavigena DSM 20109]|uniref:Glutamyl-tRNA reductase n=1 Tax=Cellulomonas flavigena (strain ATCC 482 / DSM 20109 / BCRC 11376 / JCM 18109 / NBRC 3775 / NCIMB 8073 / NRS 134) TaxID=446466 RepID=D5UCS3_CELFN|nr:glutamyl-tRNA reductase [Cellulomonas flavigena]ADG76308.1 glutamyl-tRNA reductase [Cellulomonas flavigena DSM 20109]
MVLLSLVASHHSLDLTVLERLQADVHAVGRELVAATNAVTGAVVLATCNRFELYLDVADTADTPCARRAVAQAVASRSGYSPEDVEQHLHPLVGAEAGEHLFAVASGLESMVVGEREIAGQVRRALTTARRDGTTTSTLEALFQAASRTSRAVEKSTGLGATGRSVVGVALDLAARTLPQADGDADWAAVRCVLIGTGSYAGASLAALKARGVRDVRVFSPSGRAGPFASARGVTALPAGADLLAEVTRTDLVVACSGAAGAVLGVDALAVARRGAATPLTVVDLALRHDVDPDVRTLPGVALVSLQSVAEHAPAEHAALAQAREVVLQAAADFEADRRVREWDPAVVAERTRILGGLEAALDALPTEHRDEARARSLRRRTRSLLHAPTVAARAAARDGDAAGYARALAALAAIEVPDVAPTRA